MELRSPPTLYLRLRRRVSLQRGKSITLGHIAELLIDPMWYDRLSALVLYQPRKADGNIIMIDMMRIVSAVHQIEPGMRIEYFGEPHVLVDIVGSPKKPSVLLFILVWLLLFFGSGLAIMNFHADVSMLEVQQRIVELISGQKTERPILFQIAYSIGIGFGMVVFFNHVFKKKFNEEPTPLELEIFLYQENLNHFVVSEEYDRLQKQGDSRD
ncbi:stage V sporulation protein AA [Paenibacillus guangzhouensis]|uniref:stage V sporulation protein AA n=1 Tax=Paenibacillus guangzhouensis TaxID=1473112 RepID=UPI0012669DE8|nr:stage V sporulation protein AA [Paenibacillus guangzhouensis]